MEDDVVGIFIIVAFVVIGIVSGGSIFSGPLGNTNTSGSSNSSGLSAGSENLFFASNKNPSNGQFGSTGSTGSNVTFGSNQKVYGLSPNYIFNNGKTFQNNIRNLSTVVQDITERRNMSPYADKVHISDTLSRGTFYEMVILSADNLQQNEQVTISGWHLHSTVTGSDVAIGLGSNLPSPGVHGTTPITLTNGAVVYVAQSLSPIGTSFRLNKCVGYFSENRNFDPPIHTNCPNVSEDFTAEQTLTNDCLNFINSQPLCHEPSGREIPETIGASCRAYIDDNMNYNSCVLNHRIDTDFFKNEWRVYLGQPRILWRDIREHIQLLDQNGRVVDSVSY